MTILSFSFDMFTIFYCEKNTGYDICTSSTLLNLKTRKSLINGGRVKLESGCSPSGSTLNNVWTVNHYHQFNRILARVYELKDSHAGVWDKSYSDVCRNQSNVFSSGPSCFVFPDNTFTHSVSGEPLRKLDFSSSANASGTMSTVSVETTLLCNNSIINQEADQRTHPAAQTLWCLSQAQ